MQIVNVKKVRVNDLWPGDTVIINEFFMRVITVESEPFIASVPENTLAVLKLQLLDGSSKYAFGYDWDAPIDLVG